ncbi:DMT family transporter [Paenibacillus sp. GSMTC-2017]|uniref:DMT family transporter n=1 Tax=Paenibacillus sp. GSMTC-2017 TaxID=2794350 RepID=UPI0018D8773E|nr:DMT family transporter [Paenibacillus sp. GSMTC-2017]MBH5316427.1 DMT family transporter [Paenibacillus sp. GSMTC-2017]
MRNGVQLALLSSLVFSVMNALVKEVSDTIPAAEIAFFRGIIGTLLIVVLMRQSKLTFSRNGIPMLVLRGVLGGLYMLAYFYTIAKMPLTDASILAHLSPFFVIILSALFLKEKISRATWSLLPVVFIGALLLIKPYQYSSYSIYAIAGLLSAFFAAAAGIAIRYLSKSHHAYEIVFYFVATSALVAIPFMWGEFVIPDVREGLYLLLIGLISLFGQLLLTKAFTYSNAVVVQVVSYFGIVMSTIFGYLFWSEVPDLLTIIGGVFIIVGCIALSNRKQIEEE